MAENSPNALSPVAVGTLLSVSRDTVIRLIRSGAIVGFRAGRQWRVWPHEVELYLRRASTAPTSKPATRKLPSQAIPSASRQRDPGSFEQWSSR